MKDRNCLAKSRESFWPVRRWKVTVIGRSESLLNVCGLAWVQTAQPGSAVAACFGFRGLRKIEEGNTPTEQLVYYSLPHAMVFQIDKTKVLEGLSHARSCSLTYGQVTFSQTSEINNRNFFTGAQFH